MNQENGNYGGFRGLRREIVRLSEKQRPDRGGLIELFYFAYVFAYAANIKGGKLDQTLSRGRRLRLLAMTERTQFQDDFVA